MSAKMISLRSAIESKRVKQLRLHRNKIYYSSNVLLGVTEWDICRSVRHSFVYSPTRGTYWPSFYFCAISYPRIPSWDLSLLEENSSREQLRKTSRRQSYGRIVAIPRSSECSPGAEIRYPGSRLGRTRLAKVILFIIHSRLKITLPFMLTWNNN